MQTTLKIHGRGNAWPVPLGQEHPFYDRTDCRELANASYSLYLGNPDQGGAEVLVDAGHGTIQSLISGRNRIPDCICLTHGHMDHTLSVDWVVQSFWRQHGRKELYPLHATGPVYDFLVRSYPHLGELIDHGKLSPGEPSGSFLAGHPMEKEVKLTSFPVFHGPQAMGASMLLFETGNRKILFSGDLLSPLLREKDRDRISNADLVVVDCNNRFSWPGTNHWSFAAQAAQPLKRSEVLDRFVASMPVSEFIKPNSPEAEGGSKAYQEEVAREWDPSQQPFTILEFCRKYNPARVVLVHYSGAEDLRHHGEAQLGASELEAWANESGQKAGVDTQFYVPATGEEIKI